MECDEIAKNFINSIRIQRCKNNIALNYQDGWGCCIKQSSPQMMSFIDIVRLYSIDSDSYYECCVCVLFIQLDINIQGDYAIN